MFKHYFATALRHCRQHKATTAINVACLWFGLVAFTIAYGITSVYFQMDRHHEKANRTYFVTQDSRFQGGAANTGPVVTAGSAIGPHLKTDYPELEIVARVTPAVSTAVAAGEAKQFMRVSYADADLLEVLDIDFAAGDRRNALRKPRSAVISEFTARTLFKDRDPMGQTVLLNGGTEVRITGVAKVSTPSAYVAPFGTGKGSWGEFALLVDWDTAEAVRKAQQDSSTAQPDNYFQHSVLTYVVFKDGAELTPNRLSDQLGAFSTRHVPADRGQAILGLRLIGDTVATFLDTAVQTHRSGVSFVSLMLGSGILILCIACLNYANLASAQAATRLKELALLRAVGASRNQVVTQVLAEAAIVVLVSTALLVLSLPVILTFLAALGGGIDYRTFVFGAIEYWQWLAVVVISAIVLASAYPAVAMTRIRPAHALHSGRTPLGNRRAMRWIVIGQCVTATVLLVFTSIMSAQNQLSSRGFDWLDDALLVVANDLQASNVDALVLKNELRGQPMMKSVAGANGMPGGGFPYRIVMTSREPASRSFTLLAPVVDENFFATMGIELVAGRNFNAGIASDLSPDDRHGNVVIDTALASRFGWSNPHDAVGKEVFIPATGATNATGIPRTIIGVVESKVLTPMTYGTDSSQLFSFNPAQATTLVARLPRDNVKAGLAATEAVWNRVAPNIPLDTDFVDQTFQQTVGPYGALAFAGRGLGLLALFIASMGIMGIAIHSIAQRTFEIGVRKTLGARMSGIFAMLLKDFSKPIVLANLIAWPLAYLLGKGYTTLFANQASITAAPFVGSLLFGLAIAWLAISRQAWRAARLNPATVLRHE